MNTQYAGNLALVPSGNHNSALEWKKNAVVYSEAMGSTYYARKDVPAGTAITNNEYWMKGPGKGDKGLKGDKGDKGDQGQQGIQGPAGGTWTVAEEIPTQDGSTVGIKMTTYNQQLQDNNLQLAAIAAKRWVTGNKIVLFADSIVARNGPSDTTTSLRQLSSHGYFNWANVFLGQPFNVIANTGVPGNNSDQMIARIQEDVLDYEPDFCLLPLTPNDILGEWPASKIIANYISMFDLLTSNGIKVITATCVSATSFFDEGNSATRLASWHAINKWLKDYVRDNDNIIMADIASVETDATTGRPLTGKTDGIHPYGYLAIRMGKMLADELRPHVKLIDDLPTTNIDSKNLLTNGMMVGNNSGVATGWTVTAGTGATIEKSKAARTDFIQGEVQVINVTVKGTGNTMLQSSSIVHGLTEGTEVYSEIEFEVENVTDLAKIYSSFSFQNSSYADLKSSYAMFVDPTDPALAYPTFSGVLRTAPYPVPTDGVRCVLRVYFLGTGTFKFKRARIWKIE